VKTVKATLTSINNDPRRAQLTLIVEPGIQPILGEITLRNDGNDGSGEYRASGVLLKNALALPGDTLLLYGELDGTDTPELGTAIGSVSYTLPLADTVGLTGSFGFTRRTPVELEEPFRLLTTDQYQGQLQLEWTFHETLLQRWSVTAAINRNENQLSFDGDPLPSSYPSALLNPRTGFMRIAVNGNGMTGPLAWGGTTYLLQGLSGLSPTDQLDDLSRIGIVPGQATAMGALVSTNWFFAPSWQMNLRAGGQVAFQPLTSPMQFSIGSDVGIRGLPGQLVSGDSGWITTGELVWTFWQTKTHALQLVPFIGAGGVTTDLDGTTFNDVVGSGGLLARWLAGDNLSLELGYAHTFNTDNNPGAWEDWLLGTGLYAKASFRF
jgi:hemolysin activation/secretion protein